MYAYIGNDPLNGVDPSGAKPECSTRSCRIHEAKEAARENLRGMRDQLRQARTISSYSLRSISDSYGSSDASTLRALEGVVHDSLSALNSPDVVIAVNESLPLSAYGEWDPLQPNDISVSLSWVSASLEERVHTILHELHHMVRPSTSTHGNFTTLGGLTASDTSAWGRREYAERSGSVALVNRSAWAFACLLQPYNSGHVIRCGR